MNLSRVLCAFKKYASQELFSVITKAIFALCLYNIHFTIEIKPPEMRANYVIISKNWLTL